MFYVYDSGFRITSNPISYNFLLGSLFVSAKLDWQKVSTLPLGECYTYENFKIVRMV